MSSNAEGSMVHSKELAKILECPVCLDLPLPPIFNCVNGHIICSQCKPKIASNTCVLCQGKYTNIRNLVAESIVEASSMKCIYSEHGCDKVIPGNQYKHHAANCDFRPIKCFDNRMFSCQGKFIDYGSFFHHIKHEHKDEGYDEEKESYEKIARCTSFDIDADGPYYYLKHDGKLFIQHTRLSNKMLYWWITLVGPQDEADQYKSTITVYSKSMENMFNFQYTIPVFSIRYPAEEIIKKRFVASLSAESILPFCTSGMVKDGREYKHSWYMKYSIQKIKSEFATDM